MSEVQKSTKRNTEVSYLYGDLPGGSREAFKRLRANVSLSFEDAGCHVIGLTSACASEGKSLVSINLASALAEIGKNVMLLDGDVYRPSIHQKLKLSTSKGLTEMARNNGNFSVAVQRYDVTPEYGFDFIASGEAADDPSEILNNKGLSRLISRLRDVYEYIIIDMPPIGSVADVSALGRLSDGVLFVVREGSTPKALIRECIEQLNYAKINVIGFVMNGASSASGSGYSGGKGYGYGYGYGYGSDSKKS